jgi:hypothetical protein
LPELQAVIDVGAQLDCACLIHAGGVIGRTRGAPLHSIPSSEAGSYLFSESMQLRYELPGGNEPGALFRNLG